MIRQGRQFILKAFLVVFLEFVPSAINKWNALTVKKKNPHLWQLRAVKSPPIYFQLLFAVHVSVFWRSKFRGKTERTERTGWDY